MKVRFLVAFLKLCLLVQISYSLEKLVSRIWTECGAPGQHYSSRSGLTFQQCITECVNRLECKALSYRIHVQVCMFHASVQSFVTNTNSKGPCIFVRREDIVNAPLDAAAAPCQSNAWETYDPDTQTCNRRECSLFSLSNGKFYGNMNVIGSRVKFTCNSGFKEVKERNNATCTETGTWSYIPQCIPACGEPPARVNSVVAAGGSSPGDTRQYSCDNNYNTLSANVDMVTTCLEGGSWSPTDVACLWDCGEPPPYRNSKVNDGNNFDGTTRHYTCNTGYTFEVGSVSIRSTSCVASETWTPASFTCISDCGNTRYVDNARVLPGERTQGTQRKYECKANYYTNSPDSDLVTTCQPNGVWTTTSFNCLLVKTIGEPCYFDSDCKETNSSCIQNICFCSFFYRYNTETNDCVRACTTISTEFIQHNNKAISIYTFTYVSGVRPDSCKVICLNTSGCVAFVYTTNGGCYVSELSVQMIEDATPGNIRSTDYTNIYVRDCT